MPRATAGEYTVEPNWLMPDDEFGPLTDIADAAVDADDHVYLLARHPGRLLVLTPEGDLLHTMGADVLSDRPHGVNVGPDGRIYCIDEPRHAIAVFTVTAGFTEWIGNLDSPSDSGYDSQLPPAEQLDSIQRAAAPFNRPTQVAALLHNGSAQIFVTDGYGNAAVHRMTADGGLLQTWGGPGPERGKFRTPHYACVVGSDTLIVCDRENGRVQVFDLDGNLRDIWPGQRPSAVAYLPSSEIIFVAEMGVDPGTYLGARGQVEKAEPPRIRILTLTGDQIGEILPSSPDPTDNGSFMVPHGLAVDSSGNLYVAETTSTYRRAREKRREDPASPSWIFGLRTDFPDTPLRFHSLQKLAVKTG